MSVQTPSLELLETTEVRYNPSFVFCIQGMELETRAQPIVCNGASTFTIRMVGYDSIQKTHNNSVMGPYST